MRLFLLASALIAVSSAEDIRLGEAVRADQTPSKLTLERFSGSVAAIPIWYNTGDRAAVTQAYLTEYAPLRGTPLGWTGSIATGTPGATSDAYRSAVARAVNWFRAMAGVPATITLDSVLNAKAPQGALMIAANQALSHTPPTTWLLYTTEGAEALGRSNICQGFVSDPGCVDLYIWDPGLGNTAAGHRRWILNPPTTTMGTGDVLGGSNLWNALWVVPPWGLPRPATREAYVAWPPPGYVPYQVVFPRWSFSHPSADFANATVTMTRGGSSVPVNIESRNGGYGDPAVVWVPDNQNTNSFIRPTAPSADIVYTVNVQNVIVGGTARTFTYQVTVFDPGAAATTFNFSPGANTAVPASGGSYSTQLTVTPTGTAWTATSSAGWVHITQGATGTGNAVVVYTVEANPGSQRSATITAGTATHTIVQAGTSGACSYNVGSGSLSTTSTGTVSAVSLITAAGCTWSASSNRSWVQVYPLNGSGTQAVTVTVFPNFSTQQRSASLTIGGQAVTVTQASASGTADERFVGLTYFNFFGRNAAPSEITFQVVNALQRGVSRSQLTMNFYGSEEFNVAGRFVAGLYVGLLGRDAEYGGWLFQRNAFATGQVNQTSLVNNFLNSAEFQTKHGALTNAQLIELLYLQVLGRTVSPADVAFQESEMQKGMSRVQFAVNLLNSDEFRNSFGARLTAFLLYAAILNREPSTAELQMRANQISGGTPVQSLVAAFLNTPEFQALIQ